MLKKESAVIERRIAQAPKPSGDSMEGKSKLR
jgi:hypothetical protein